MELSKKDLKGFTLIEVVTVISILGIIGMILMPTYVEMMDKARERVCTMNCAQYKKMYDSYLVFENKEHSEVIFQEFIDRDSDEICPSEGIITYIDDEIICDRHISGGNEEEEEAPIL